MLPPLRWGLLLLLAAGVGLFLYAVKAIMPPFLLAAGLAYLTNPAVRRLEAREVPRPVAIILVYVALVIFLAAFILFILPPVLQELNDIVANLPQRTRYFENLSEELFTQYRRARLPDFLRPVVDSSLRSFQTSLRVWAGRVVTGVLGFFSHSVFFLLSPVLAYYLTRDAAYMGTRFLALVPAAWREDLARLGREINATIEAYVAGQLLVGLMVGGIIAAGLAFLGIPYAMAIGLFAAILDLIPYFGPIIAALPAVVLALAISLWKALYVILLFLAANQIEGAILAPRIVGNRVGLHPVAVIFALLAGEELLGFLGMLLAVPVAAVVKVAGGFLLEKLIVTRSLD